LLRGPRIDDASIGRFLQTDPIGYEGDLNLYAYVRNDSQNQTDPTGEDGLMITLDGWNAGDTDMVTHEDLPGRYGGVAFAIGLDDEGNLEVGIVRSGAEGEDVAGDGVGAYAGVGVYRGEIKDLETTTHTGMLGIGPVNLGGSARIEESESGDVSVDTDVGSIGVPGDRVGLGAGLGGVVATPETKSDSAVIMTREQIERAGRAIGHPID
jgi:uncharacterized protein RhaS with RHS repeats